jgi:hypothetical protein
MIEKFKRYFRKPDSQPQPSTGMLAPKEAADLTASILNFTQGQDNNIPLFAHTIHLKQPDWRIDPNNKQTQTYIVDQVQNMMKHSTHIIREKSVIEQLARENIRDVADYLEDQDTFSHFSENQLSAGIIGALLERDEEFRKGRPGEKSPILLKTCLYIFETEERRKKTAIEPLNEVFKSAALYIQHATKEQFSQDIQSLKGYTLEFPHLLPAENLLSIMDTVISQYNLTHSEKPLAKPPCLQNYS